MFTDIDVRIVQPAPDFKEYLLDDRLDFMGNQKNTKMPINVLFSVRALNELYDAI